jgi:hypothetical protein
MLIDLLELSQSLLAAGLQLPGFLGSPSIQGLKLGLVPALQGRKLCI